jgi:hypothetical protein
MHVYIYISAKIIIILLRLHSFVYSIIRIGLRMVKNKQAYKQNWLTYEEHKHINKSSRTSLYINRNCGVLILLYRSTNSCGSGSKSWLFKKKFPYLIHQISLYWKSCTYSLLEQLS